MVLQTRTTQITTKSQRNNSNPFTLTVMAAHFMSVQFISQYLHIHLPSITRFCVRREALSCLFHVIYLFIVSHHIGYPLSRIRFMYLAARPTQMTSHAIDDSSRTRCAQQS